MGCARVRVGGIKIPFHAQVLTKFTLHTAYLDLGKRGHFVADTLLQTQMFPRLSARTTFVANTNFVSGTQKMFLILFRNILCLQQIKCLPVCAVWKHNIHFVSRAFACPRDIMSNNVSATMCPRLRVYLSIHKSFVFLLHCMH